MEPARRGTMPMTDLRVVVLPAPLRPRRVTTSPRLTSKSTPWSTWDSPYQACRSRTSRSAPSAMGSAVTLAHVGLDDVGISRHAGVVPLRENLSAGEHGDGVREVGDHAQVVLHHEHGAIDGGLANKGGDAVHVLVGHAGGGLVEQ